MEKDLIMEIIRLIHGFECLIKVDKRDCTGVVQIIKGIRVVKKDEAYNVLIYKITERIEKLGIRESLEDLLKTHLGHFEMIKNTLISYFQ